MLLALDEFFLMYERFQNSLWKFYKKDPHQTIFITPLAQKFGFLVCGARQRKFASLKAFQVDGPYDYTQFEKILNGIER